MEHWTPTGIEPTDYDDDYLPKRIVPTSEANVQIDA